MVEDFSPRDSLERVLHYWWVIALAMIAGGLIGWSISRLSPPVYEARAGYRVTLDEDILLAELHKTDPGAELTYDMKAPYLTPVALVFYTLEVRSAVEQKALSEGLDFPKDGFKTGQLYLDQHGTQWTIVVRHDDSDTAAKLANLWVATADEQLKMAHEQAILAVSFKAQLALLDNCLSKASLADFNRCAGTSFDDSAEMQAYHQDLASRMQDAFAASEGISTLVNIDRGQVAEPPARPLYYSAGLLMVAGSLLGLILGGVAVQRLRRR